ncbi:hypothetical protein [Desulfatiferula olefinivorans]
MDDQFIDTFLKDGLLYMNNIDYFKKYEDSDIALRGDIYEGLAASYNANQLIIKIGDIVIEDAIGKVDVGYNVDNETNIYCMTKISDGKILDAGDEGLYLSEKFLKFGNKAVVIGGSNISEFENRLRKAFSSDNSIYIPRNDGILAKQVTYLDRDKHHGPMNVFNKFEDYSWQYEWRIAVNQASGRGPYKFKIGSLYDIAHVFESDDLIKEPLRLLSNNL